MIFYPTFSICNKLYPNRLGQRLTSQLYPSTFPLLSFGTAIGILWRSDLYSIATRLSINRSAIAILSQKHNVRISSFFDVLNHMIQSFYNFAVLQLEIRKA